VEDRHVEILQQVRDAVTVPVAVKLSPHFSSTGEMAMRLDRAGANGLVLFNRFLQPDVDPEALAVTTGVTLSSPAEARVARTWIAILRGHVTASLAATTGVDQSADVAAYLLAGADVVMTASALLRHGVGHAGVLLDGLEDWMRRKGFATPEEFRGLVAVPVGVDQSAYERAGYVEALEKARTTYGDLTPASPRVDR
jgi:dihydroorotate dehydrogenase (fumarate)